MAERMNGQKGWKDTYRQRGSKAYPEGYTRQYAENYDKIDWSDDGKESRKAPCDSPCEGAQ